MASRQTSWQVWLAGGAVAVGLFLGYRAVAPKIIQGFVDAEIAREKKLRAERFEHVQERQAKANASRTFKVDDSRAKRVPVGGAARHLKIQPTGLIDLDVTTPEGTQSRQIHLITGRMLDKTGPPLKIEPISTHGGRTVEERDGNIVFTDQHGEERAITTSGEAMLPAFADKSTIVYYEIEERFWSLFRYDIGTATSSQLTPNVLLPERADATIATAGTDLWVVAVNKGQNRIRLVQVNGPNLVRIKTPWKQLRNPALLVLKNKAFLAVVDGPDEDASVLVVDISPALFSKPRRR